MDHLELPDFDTTFILFTVIVGIFGVIIARYWSKIRNDDPTFIHAKEERLKSDNDELKKENNYWRGKANQKRGDVKIEGDFNMDDDNSIVSLAKSVLPGVIDLFPEDIQKHAKGLLTNPDLIDLAHEFYKTDPAGVKSLLNSFLKNRKTDSGQSPPVPAITESTGHGAA